MFSTESVEPTHSGESRTIHIFAPGTCLGERYEILRVLGIGGSAVVYAALDRHLESTVALKVLRADRLDEGALRRFRREVSIARKANSAHLVRMFDIEESADAIYLSMELLDGGTLRDELKHGALPIDRILSIAGEILEALEVLHGLGIVHRDVKPGNVLFTASGSLKLGDFGLAREWDDGGARLTRTGVVLGTLEYLAPEQALGRSVDARTDLYSLGILLYELLTGDVPHARQSSLGTLLAHVQEEVPSVRALRPEAPRWLASIVSRLLEKDPARRYASAHAVRRDLQRRRGPGIVHHIRSRAMTAAAGAVLAACIVAGTIAIRTHHLSRFDHLGQDDGSIYGVDRRGRVLWRKNAFVPQNHAAIARLWTDQRRVLILFSGDGTGIDRVREHTAGIYDLQTGELLRTIRFTHMGKAFPEHSDTFSPARVFVDDLDGDSWDEVVVTFTHAPFYPSYTVLHDSVSNAMRPVLLASGHQRPHGAVDVDGDGIKELVFAGVLNRMGWYTGLGIVRAPVRSIASVNWLPAATPDASDPSTSESGLLWYALLPTGGYLAQELAIDEKARVFVVPYPDGKSVRVPFDVRHEEHRRASFANLRIAQQSMESFPADAAVRAEAALRSARAAEDRVLAEWCERVLARALVAAGDSRGGRERFASLFERSAEAANIAYDAGVAFHVAGRLDEAARWYHLGFARTEGSKGRHRYEHLVGLVMALAEQSRWSEARQRIEEFGRVVPGQATTAAYCRAFVDWRESGRVGDIPTGANTDVERYWELELRLARGDDPAVVKSGIERALHLDSGLRPLLLSVLSLCEARLGNQSASRQHARDALEMTSRGSARDPILRGHLSLVRARAGLPR